MHAWSGVPDGRKSRAETASWAARAQAVLDELRGGLQVRVEGEDEVLLAVLAGARDEDLEELKRLWRLGKFGWPVASKVVVILDAISAKRASEEARTARHRGGMLSAIGRWLWRRWLLLFGAVSGTVVAVFDFLHGFEAARRFVALALTLLGR